MKKNPKFDTLQDIVKYIKYPDSNDDIYHKWESGYICALEDVGIITHSEGNTIIDLLDY